MPNASTYTDEHRIECADYVISSGKSATEVAKEIGVRPKALQHWVKAKARPARRQKSRKAGVCEMKRLQKRIRELE